MVNAVHAIKTPAGALVGKTSEILKEFKRYYSSLYQSTSPTQQDQDSFFENASLFQQLTEHHREFLDEAITQEEIKAAVMGMKSGKAMGPDGFPVEFFKSFLDLLLPSKEITFNLILETGEMPPSWHQATLIPIPKTE